jgi:hypothetical protein
VGDPWKYRMFPGVDGSPQYQHATGEERFYEKGTDVIGIVFVEYQREKNIKRAYQVVSVELGNGLC